MTKTTSVSAGLTAVQAVSLAEADDQLVRATQLLAEGKLLEASIQADLALATFEELFPDNNIRKVRARLMCIQTRLENQIFTLRNSKEHEKRLLELRQSIFALGKGNTAEWQQCLSLSIKYHERCLAETIGLLDTEIADHRSMLFSYYKQLLTCRSSWPVGFEHMQILTGYGIALSKAGRIGEAHIHLEEAACICKCLSVHYPPKEFFAAVNLLRSQFAPKEIPYEELRAKMLGASPCPCMPAINAATNFLVKQLAEGLEIIRRDGPHAMQSDPRSINALNQITLFETVTNLLSQTHFRFHLQQELAVAMLFAKDGHLCLEFTDTSRSEPIVYALRQLGLEPNPGLFSQKGVLNITSTQVSFTGDLGIEIIYQ